ncbi:MAG: ABC transporter permease [Treponema sp.]|jgi:phospholipid/cholesterol/gamma-HCH transport system permease protein|nr:ABC transporter permease [Treponema sp.]
MKNVSGALKELFYSLGIFTRTLRGIGAFFLRGQAAHHLLILQILFTFVEALGIASLLALGIGAVVNVIGIPTLSRIGQQQLIYPLLILIITRELGPLLTAFIISARSATAIATEMAGMVVSHEVEAYLSIGVDPIEYLAVPRFLGVTISMFLLNIFFSIFGLAGSFAVAQLFSSLPADVYFTNLLQSLTVQDIFISVVKSIVFGMIVSITGIIYGLAVVQSSTEIPVAGLKAVGSSFALCIIVDILLSAMYYMVIGLRLWPAS